MEKKRGKARFTKNEAKRLGEVAKELGATVELDPATGTYKMIFNTKGEATKSADHNDQDEPVNAAETNGWDEELYGKDQA